MPKFIMQAKLELTCQKAIEADTEEEAYEHADTMDCDEWMQGTVAREEIEDVILIGLKPSAKKRTQHDRNKDDA